MRRVTNCILIDKDRILLIRKPRRNWYAIPGGKMEPGETIKEAAVREYEETALNIHKPELSGVFTFIERISEEETLEWMMFTFVSYSYDGRLVDSCEEGILEWIPIKDISGLPMADGDYKIFEHVLQGIGVMYGAFSYTEDNKLLELRLDPPIS